ncbi:hypothetical protein [Enterococcus faecalis]|uniref:hypothetical protein n=1 Tax=Enterococcus faecalis TaxID=1351 RepID=UPI003D105106
MREYVLNKYVTYKKITNNKYHLYEDIHNKHYLVSDKEIYFWEALNLSDSTLDLCQLTDYKQNEIEKFLNDFENVGLVNPTKRKFRLSLKLSGIKKSLFTKLLERVILTLIFASLPLFVLFAKWIDIETIRASLKNELPLILILEFGIIVILSVLFHEFGHLLIAVNRGIMVPTLRISSWFKVISVDTTGMRFLDSGTDKIWIYFGGPLVNLFLSICCFWAVQFNLFEPFFLIGWIVNFMFFLQSLCILFRGTDGNKIIGEAVESTIIHDNMNIYVYIKCRKSLSKEVKYMLDFLWIQKIILIYLGIACVYSLFTMYN